jgi:site-specific DNA-methyltransferase (adenine-specific)
MNRRKRAFTEGLAQLGKKRPVPERRALGAIRPTLCNANGVPELNQIICGDSIAILNEGPKAWIDLCFADPPFNTGYFYDGYDDRRNAEDYLQFSRDWMKAVHRALKPQGSFFLAIGDDFAADLCVIARRELGFFMRNWIIWHYTFGQQPQKKFARSHTHILYFTKDEKQFTFNADPVRIPSARQTTYSDPRANPKGKLPDDVWFLRPQEAPQPFFAADGDTWNVSRVCGTFKEREGWHGCQMPVGVLNRIITAASNRGDVVVDPFNGSGTTTVAAALLGRSYVGIDQSAEYVAFARARLDHTLEKMRAGAARGDVFDSARASRFQSATDALGRPRVGRKPAKSA